MPLCPFAIVCAPCRPNSCCPTRLPSHDQFCSFLSNCFSIGARVLRRGVGTDFSGNESKNSERVLASDTAHPTLLTWLRHPSRVRGGNHCGGPFLVFYLSGLLIDPTCELVLGVSAQFFLQSRADLLYP